MSLACCLHFERKLQLQVLLKLQLFQSCHERKILLQISSFLFNDNFFVIIFLVAIIHQESNIFSSFTKTNSCRFDIFSTVCTSLDKHLNNHFIRQENKMNQEAKWIKLLSRVEINFSPQLF